MSLKLVSTLQATSGGSSGDFNGTQTWHEKVRGRRGGGLAHQNTKRTLLNRDVTFGNFGVKIKNETTLTLILSSMNKPLGVGITAVEF